eukprot:scaffold301614_cov28-Tisochrysis_lutea.AAC.6
MKSRECASAIYIRFPLVLEPRLLIERNTLKLLRQIECLRTSARGAPSAEENGMPPLPGVVAPTHRVS